MARKAAGKPSPIGRRGRDGIADRTGYRRGSSEPAHGACVGPLSSAIVAEPIKAVLGRALAVSPLSDDDFQLFRPKPAGAHNHLLAAEVACGLLHVVLMGGFCPLGLISAAALFFGQRARCSRRSLSVPLDCSESAAKN
jgi:hypothetical protein